MCIESWCTDEMDLNGSKWTRTNSLSVVLFQTRSRVSRLQASIRNQSWEWRQLGFFQGSWCLYTALVAWVLQCWCRAWNLQCFLQNEVRQDVGSYVWNLSNSRRTFLCQNVWVLCGDAKFPMKTLTCNAALPSCLISSTWIRLFLHGACIGSWLKVLSSIG